MRNIIIIIRKQLKDTLKNKTVLIQFLMFPVLGIIMTRTIQIQNMPPNFFVNLFATMYIGMAPLTAIAAIISEEKEKHTLRVLRMADVSAAQYLIGIGSYVFAACMLGGVVFCCLLEDAAGVERMLYLLIMAVGVSASILVGAAIGVGSKNQMSATSVTVPVMMLFSFLPMLSMFNDKIEKIARLTYSEQIRVLLSGLEGGTIHASHILVITCNMILFGVLFFAFYKKRGL